MNYDELIERATMLAGEDSLDAVLELASEIVADDANVEPAHVRTNMIALAAGIVRLVPALRAETQEAHEALTAARAEIEVERQQCEADKDALRRNHRFQCDRANKATAELAELKKHALHLATRVDTPGDWACAECRPTSSMLKGDGWRCDVHALRALAKEPPRG